jgi:hypothetical protein
MAKMTPRQIREKAAYEAEKSSKTEPKKVTARETAADRRNFFRKQAGWPLLKVE